MARQPNPQRLISALMAEYNFMKDSNGNRQIAQTLLSNIVSVPTLSVEEAAELCHVSRSTFLRFCKDMDYPSYTYFRNRVAEEIRSYPELYMNSAVLADDMIAEQSEKADDILGLFLDEELKNIETMRKTVDRKSCGELCRILLEAEKVYIFDIRYLTTRIELENNLALMGKTVFFSADYEEQKAQCDGMNENCALLMCVEGTFRDSAMLDLLPIAAQNGAKLAVITPDASFAGHDLCGAVVEMGNAYDSAAGDCLWKYLSCLIENEIS